MNGNLTSENSFFSYLLMGLYFVFAFLLVAVILNVTRWFLSRRRYFSHQVFLVRLPKEKPEDAQKEVTAQQIKEEIAKGETIFAAIGGLRAERGFFSWLEGRSDHFSFEIVASHNKIAFYVVAPLKNVRYIEQQIQAYYPEAVVEEIEDYNLFSVNGQIASAYVKTNKKFFFPIKTYQKMEVDPLNSLINALSKLGKDESLAIQYLVRSARASWHSRSRRLVKKIHQKNSVSEGLKSGTPWGMVRNVFDAFSPVKKNDAPTTPKRLSAIEEEMLKSIEEKNLKTGLDVNIRIIANAKTKEDANRYLENIAAHFSEYNNFTYGNNFSRARKDRITD